MKKEFTLALFLLLGHSMSVFGQQVRWGTAQLEEINVHHRQFITKDPENLVVMRCNYAADLRDIYDYGKFKLDRYDKSLNLVQSVPLSPKLEKKSLRTEFGLNIKGNIYIVASKGDQKAKRAYYYYQKLDGKTLELLGAPVQIAEGHHNQFTDPSFCGRSISPDSMHVMLVTLNFGGPHTNEFGVYVMDRNMKLEWAKNITLPVPAMGCSFYSSPLDCQGNAYLMVQSNPEDDRALGPKAVQVFCVKNKTGEVVKLPIQAEGAKITKVIMAFDKEQRPICVGFYSTGDPEISNGCIFYRFNKETLNVEVRKSQPFPSEFLRQSMKESQLDEGKGEAAMGLNSYYFHSLVPMANGKTLLLAERSWSRPGTQTAFYFNFEIAALMFSETGELIWAKKIPKRQVNPENDSYNSFGVIRGENKVVLIYNDARENIDKSLETATGKYEITGGNGVVVKATIDSEGEITREVLFSNLEVKANSMPSWGAQSGPNQMLLPAKEFSKYLYGVVTF
jgi:hypothetical protein